MIKCRQYAILNRISLGKSLPFRDLIHPKQGEIMKGSVFTLVILLAIASCGASLFDYFAPISTSAGEYARNLSNNQNYVFEHHAAIFGGLVSEDNNISMTYNLQEGRTYKLFVFGDEDAVDLDIKIYDEDDTELASDVSVGETAYLDFTPDQDGIYRVEAINYESEANVFLLCGIMAPGNESNNDGDLFSQAFTKMINFGLELDEDEDIDFYVDTITFSGGVIAEEESGCVYDLSFPVEATVYVAAVGSDNATDVDIKMTRQESRGEVDTDWYADDDEEVCADSSIDDTALAQGEVTPDDSYAVKFRNYASEGDAFVVYFIVTED